MSQPPRRREPDVPGGDQVRRSDAFGSHQPAGSRGLFETPPLPDPNLLIYEKASGHR